MAVKAAESGVGGAGSGVKNRRWKFAELPDAGRLQWLYRVLTNAGMNSDWIGSALEQRLDQIISATLGN